MARFSLARLTFSAAVLAAFVSASGAVGVGSNSNLTAKSGAISAGASATKTAVTASNASARAMKANGASGVKRASVAGARRVTASTANGANVATRGASRAGATKTTATQATPTAPTQVVPTAPTATIATGKVATQTPAIIAPTQAAATSATTTTPAAYTLDKVVISATGYEQDVRYAPASISIVSGDELQTRPIRDLGDIVAEVPGVATETAKTGQTTVSMRGMDSSYTLVLVDGKRVNLAKNFDGQGFDSTSGWIPPASMIERVEVLRGPASTIYGSDAMGGVINIITKKSADKISGSIGLETRLHDNSKNFGHWGNSYGVDADVTVPLGERVTLGLYGKYQWSEQNSFKWADISGYTSTSYNPYTSHTPGIYKNAKVGAKASIMLGDNDRLSFDFDYGFQRLASLSTSRWSITNIRDYHRYSASVAHDGEYGDTKVSTKLHYAQVSRMAHLYSQTAPYDESIGYYVGMKKGIVNHAALLYNPAYTYSTTLTTNFDLGRAGNLILNYGPYLFWERLYDRSDGSDKEAFQAAIFAEGEYLMNDKLSLTAGLRANHVETYGMFVSPRFFVNFSPLSWLTIKAGLASGIQAPELATRYDGLYDDANYYYGNADLGVEQSWNYELGAIAQTPYATFSLTGYYTDFRDKIESQSYQPGEAVGGYGACIAASGYTCTMPVNIGRAMVYGVEAEVRSNALLTGLIPRGVYVDVSYGYAYNEALSGSTYGHPLNNFPQHKISAKLSYKLPNVTTYLRYTGNLKTPTYGAHSANAGPGEYYRDLHLLDLGANIKLGRYTLGLMVNNLLNLDTIDYFVYRSGSRLMYSNAYQRMVPGRNYWISLRASF